MRPGEPAGGTAEILVARRMALSGALARRSRLRASVRAETALRLPRLTRRAFSDLAIYGMAVGALTGVAFPFLLVGLGVPWQDVEVPGVRLACVLAGLVVGGVNHALARLVVGARLRGLSSAMGRTRAALERAATSGHWEVCDPRTCHVSIDSDDDLGEVARSHNALIDAVSHAHGVERSITEITTALASQLDIETLCRTALNELRRRSGIAAGVIAVQCPTELRVVSAGDVPDRELLSADATRRIAAFTGAHGAHGATAPTVSGWTAIALRAPGTVLGVLMVPGAAPNRQAEADRLVAILATGLGIALSNALLHQRISRLATVDELTSLPNRRSGLGALAEAVALAGAVGSHLGVAMIDIDHFKVVNDQHGHLVGDQVLAHVARVCHRAQRCDDQLFRYGGEEFLAVMPGLPPDRLAAAGERMRTAVEGTPFLGSDGLRLSVTISVGAACYHPGFDGPGHEPAAPKDLLRRADEALYRAKDDGRNRVDAGQEPRSSDHCTAMGPLHRQHA